MSIYFLTHSSKMKLLALVLLLVSCHQSPDKIKNLNGGKISSIGHGGAGLQPFYNYIPHNTMDGFRKVLKNENLDGVEMDVQMTSDHQLVLYHDKYLQDKTNCKGLVFDHRMEDIVGCKYSKDFFNFNTSNSAIVSLENSLSELKLLKPDGIFVLDLKLECKGDMSLYQDSFADELVRIIKSTGTQANLCIESTDENMLSKIQNLDSSLHLFLYVTDFKDGISRASKQGFYGLTVKYSLIQPADVEDAHQHGLRVSVWGPRTGKANSEAINLHPDYIQTDKIGNLVKKLRRYK